MYREADRITTVLVTGAAGLIGSHIVDACLARGDRVVGVDVLTDYYDVDLKRSNLASAISHDHQGASRVFAARGGTNSRSTLQHAWHLARR